MNPTYKQKKILKVPLFPQRVPCFSTCWTGWNYTRLMWMRKPEMCCKVRAQLSTMTIGMWWVQISFILILNVLVKSFVIWLWIPTYREPCLWPMQVIGFVLQGSLDKVRPMLVKQANLHPAARSMYKLMDNLLSKMPFYNVRGAARVLCIYTWFSRTEIDLKSKGILIATAW